MGKNHRHKKTLKSEKSKVKLKASKTQFLPKGANVTEVNFKVKPIVLPEQLKAANLDEPLTKRKLNFKEVLNRLNHHNVTSKLEACVGMFELINSSEILDLQLYTVLNGICKLLLDEEEKVRHKAILLLWSAVQKVDEVKLSPFFDVLTSYASCTMTHINKNVQEDSLLIIDVFNKHTPNLVVKHFDKIFTNFITLISKLRSDSKLSRTLTINLNSKITSVKWRIKVLTRLKSILQIAVSDKGAVESRDAYNVKEGDVGFYIPIYRGINAEVDMSTDAPMSNAGKYVDVLVPLLYETWAEVAPLGDNKVENGATVLKQDAASVLSCVLNIFQLLWLLLKKSGMDEKEIKKLFLFKDGQRFLSHILNQFPYRQHDAHRPKQKDLKFLEVNTDPKCVQENLLVCYIFCCLYKTFPSPFYVQKAQEVLVYLKLCLVNRNYVLIENIDVLMETATMVFFENAKYWSNRQLNVQELLDNVVHFHNHTSDCYGKEKSFHLLCSLVPVLHLRSQKYDTWLSNLSALLCEPEISKEVVDTLSELARQDNRLFLQGFVSKFPDVLENLIRLRITGEDFYPCHLKIASMFKYLPLKPPHADLMKQFVKEHDGEVAGYVREVLREKCYT